MVTTLKNEGVIISLLGRLAFPEEKLKEIIGRKKRAPEAYLRGYNSCDGKSTVTEIARIIGVNQSTLTPILQDWESRGIIYEVDSSKGKTYMKLYSLLNPKGKKASSVENLNSPDSMPAEQPILSGGDSNG